MSVKRRDLVQYLERHGFRLHREGGNHSIYTDGAKVVPVKRHSQLDRITANAICKQAGLKPKFSSRLATGEHPAKHVLSRPRTDGPVLAVREKAVDFRALCSFSTALVVEFL